MGYGVCISIAAVKFRQYKHNYERSMKRLHLYRKPGSTQGRQLIGGNEIKSLFDLSQGLC